MTPERWQRIRPILDRALELRGEERTAFLLEHCGDDAALRADVETLLRAEARGGLSLDAPVGEYADALVAELADAALRAEGGAVPGTESDPLGLRGATVGGYRVEELIGVGGMGVVYRATDLRLGRAVALKFLPPAWSLDQRAKERFLHEARTAASLDHPNICTIHEANETADGTLYIAMAFYTGETLRTRLERGPVEVPEAVDLAVQIARGLAVAHAQGLVHRDIKPANLLVTTDGTLKILDFGVAKAADVALSTPEQRPGTAAYMAPEQARGEAVDGRADLWSLGMVLYELLTGKRPAAAARAGERVPAPSTLRPGVPTGVDDLMLRLLAQDRDDRPDSAAQVARALGYPPPRPLRRWRRMRARTRRAVTVAVALLSLLVAGYVVRWATAIGPPESLMAEGAIEEGDRIVIADFGGTRTDPGLGAVVTDALRIDLLETPILSVLEASEVREVLDRMQMEDDATLTSDLAREVAVRNGAEAVLEGEVGQAGNGYVLTAVLRAAQTGHSLAAFRETAASPDDVIPAIDRLSRGIRRRAGESLQSIDATPALNQVTTSSLDALRLYSQATRAFERANYERAAALLEQAVELDPAFAMAWRGIAVSHGVTGTDPTREVEAYTRAYELRDRLRLRERYLAEVGYHRWVTGDREATIQAYQRLLDLDPDFAGALNNLGNMYVNSQDYDAAVELLQRAVAGPGVSAFAFVNLISARVGQGRLDLAHEAVDAFAARYPDHPEVVRRRFWILFLEGDESGARAQVTPLLDAPELPSRDRSNAYLWMALLALWWGNMAEAREHLRAAERIERDEGPIRRLDQRLRTAHAEVAVGDPDRGVRLLRQGIEEGMLDALPPANQSHFVQAIIFGMAGRTDEAEAVLRRFEAEVPEELQEPFRLWNLSAQALIPLQRGGADDAVRLLEQVRASMPCRFCYAERMGWALREAGRLSDAAKEWETALAWKDINIHGFEWQFIQNIWTLQRIPEVYEELGDTARALHHYRRLVELWEDADAELQPRVEHARQRIAALETRQ